MKKLIIGVLPLLFIFTTNAQVLFNEDFNSYPAGHLINDYTSTTPGQGGWFSGGTPPVEASILVIPETGKGNVVTITSNGTSPLAGMTFRQPQGVINVLWNNRTAGNNILKFEYEFYGVDNFVAHGELLSPNNLINVVFLSSLKRIVGNYWDNTTNKSIVLKNYNTDPFPYNTWIKAEMFIDYNTKNVYFYIPTLNLQATGTFSHNKIPEGITFSANNLNSQSVVKFDNIKLSALQTLPSYILSTNEQLATKFNMYPNPAKNIVNITNNENMFVNQVTVYDVTGKQLSVQSFNNETQIQLNVENLISGTYMLHITTNQGTAVKKLVK